ncbi:hypothetical protein B0T24DRAFT_685585 [Lasiosphaeria ovina]|uniref:Uncharacterized protein n=1 Tax=Lasiosphaeria ovina TaxID=92902 RepID=A0AAE0JRL4_9PEZI|nr:hypothetical protein B0T24DRAFT_685585 [Lasiosphaeria ovina]
MAVDSDDPHTSSIRRALPSDTGEKALFALGGVVDSRLPLPGCSTTAKRARHATTVAHPIVTIYWRTPGSCGNITLPFLDVDDAECFPTLVNDCSSGRIDGFHVDFNPYDYGIMDTIAQVLGPSGENGFRGVRAELDELRIYCPSQTQPRKVTDAAARPDNELGSLVVCLPHEHKGGLVTVRRQGREETFDWAADSAFRKIQWAVFRGDSEVTQAEVTWGHRVVLAYRLYWTTYGPGAMADHGPVLSAETLSWSKALEGEVGKMDREKDVLLGYTCTGAYLHRSTAVGDDIRRGLRGVDMVVFQVLKHLAEDVRVEVVLDDRPATARRDQAGVSRSAPIIIADSQDDESQQLVDSHVKEETPPEAQDAYVRSTSQAPAEQDPYQGVEWLNHSPASSAAQKSLVVVQEDAGSPLAAEASRGSAVVIARIAPRREEARAGEKRKRHEGTMVMLYDASARAKRVSRTKYEVTLTRGGKVRYYDIIERVNQSGGEEMGEPATAPTALSGVFPPGDGREPGKSSRSEYQAEQAVARI